MGIPSGQRKIHADCPVDLQQTSNSFVNCEFDEYSSWKRHYVLSGMIWVYENNSKECIRQSEDHFINTARSIGVKIG